MKIDVPRSHKAAAVAFDTGVNSTGLNPLSWDHHISGLGLIPADRWEALQHVIPLLHGWLNYKFSA